LGSFSLLGIWFRHNTCDFFIVHYERIENIVTEIRHSRNFTGERRVEFRESGGQARN
jgi:hypothetical protein